MLFGGEMAAAMRVLETADASKKEVRHHASEEVPELPDTVTAGDASVSLDPPPPSQPAPSGETGERKRIA
jgi:hypothetical protein